jgi:hypothetical protein
VDSLLYTLNVVLAYALMLLFMTYDPRVCGAVVVGCFVGHLGTGLAHRGKRVQFQTGDHCCDQ